MFGCLISGTHMVNWLRWGCLNKIWPLLFILAILYFHNYWTESLCRSIECSPLSLCPKSKMSSQERFAIVTFRFWCFLKSKTHISFHVSVLKFQLRLTSKILSWLPSIGEGSSYMGILTRRLGNTRTSLFWTLAFCDYSSKARSFSWPGSSPAVSMLD